MATVPGRTPNTSFECEDSPSDSTTFTRLLFVPHFYINVALECLGTLDALEIVVWHIAIIA
jgi:hypothetical protein